MLDVTSAAVVLDALLETGRAEWPGVGTFTLVARSQPSQHGPLVHVFPTRTIEFEPDPVGREALAKFLVASGQVVVAGLGTLAGPDCTFVAEPGLVSRVRAMPLQLMKPEVAPPPRPRVEPEPPEPPKPRSWWRRLFDLEP